MPLRFMVTERCYLIYTDNIEKLFAKLVLHDLDPVMVYHKNIELLVAQDFKALFFTAVYDPHFVLRKLEEYFTSPCEVKRAQRCDHEHPAHRVCFSQVVICEQH